MLVRRRLLGTTVFGGLLGTVATPHVASPSALGQITDRQVQDIVQALNDLRKTLDARYSGPEISSIRQKQIDFLRASGKLPEFIDVGTDVWLGVYDWHVQHHQPIALGRDASGRYTIMLMQTMVIMRPDALPTFVGVPYDNR